MTRSISFSRPMTGSSLPSRASSVRSRPKLIQRRRLALASCPSPPAASPARLRGPSRLRRLAQQVQYLLAHLFQLQPQVHQHLCRHAVLLAQQAEQQVLGADIVVVQVARLFDRVLDDLLGPRRLRQLAHRDHVRAALDELLDLQADLAQVDVQVLKHVRADARSLP